MLGGGGEIRVAAFKLVSKKSFVFPIKICKNIWKLHFASLRCQTACLKELINQQKYGLM